MDKNKAIIRAQRFVQRGYVDKAIGEYEQILEADPNDIIVRLRLGDLYAKRGEKEGAVKHYLEVARIHAKRGFSLKAIAVYKQILKLNEGLIDCHLKLADLYKKQGFMADAMHHYAVVIKHYEDRGSVSDILSILKKLSEADPANLPVRARLVKTLFHVDDIKGAMKVVEETSQMLNQKNELDKLELFYRRLLEGGLRNEMIYKGLIDVYSRLGEKNALLEIYRELLTIFKEEGAEDKIADVCREILDISPSDTYAMEVLGLKCEEGDKEEALEDKAEDAEIEEEAAEEARGAGTTIEETGFESELERGEVEYHDEIGEAEILEMPEEGEDYETHYNMGIAYMEMGLYDEAIKEFKIASKDYLFQFDSYNRLGLCLVSTGRPEEACEYFEKGLNLPGRTDSAYTGLTYELALAYEASGDLKRAFELFKEVEEKDRGFRGVAEKVEELSRKIERGDASAL